MCCKSRCPQGAPKAPRDAPKTPQDAPKTHPRRTQDAPYSTRIGSGLALEKVHYLGECSRHQEQFDASLEDLAKEYRTLQDMPRKRDRDGAYLAERRAKQLKFHEALKEHEDSKGMVEDAFAEAVLEVFRGQPFHVQESCVVAEFTNEVLHRHRAKQTEEQRAREAAAAADSVQGDHWIAAESYSAYFLAGTRRDPSEGALGTWSPDPPQTPGQNSWDDTQWAMFFLQLGGFEPSKAGAEQMDGQGWLCLHYAIQTTVYWSKGIAVCRVLIQMMDTRWLQAKTAGGRPTGYTPLHLASNGSDKMLQRHLIVKELLSRHADVNARDNGGRTPLHHAAGSGVVDTAQALVDAGADLHATDDTGKNALDKAARTSGSMAGSRMGGNFWVRELRV